MTTYSLERTQAGGSSVDLLNREAIREFIDVYYEEFYRRFPEHFGHALPATFSDHEGFYGSACAWTPALFETFRRLKGYDLEPLLPGLTYDIGRISEKLRCDYLDVISEIYVDSFFTQINDWCAAHGIEYSAHVWEESLFFGPAYQGDYYRISRSMANPSCDSIEEWGRQSVWLKELASIADFEGQRLICENQGLQGDDSFLSPGKMRSVSNSLGAWNVGEFIPHAFNYDLARINFPPDWFRAQPFLPWFRPYADLIRRMSSMNRDSFEVADLLLYYPQVSVFGQSGTVLGMQGRRGMLRILADSAWTEDAVLTNSQFALLKLRLSEERLDYKVADDSYLAESRVEGHRLAISTSRFRALVLPPMSMIRRRSAERVAEFYHAGGIVIAMDRLPSISVEEGRDDAHLRELWESVFDSTPTLAPVTMRSNAAGGRAYYTRGSVGNTVDLLRSLLDHDVDVVSGPGDHLHVLHKRKDGLDFYWVVNDSAAPRTNLLRFRASGRPERWDGPTGKRMPVFYQTEGAQTVVRLALGPWDAAYIVFGPAGPAQPLALRATNLDEFAIERAGAEEVVVRGRAVVGKGPAFVELDGDGKTWRGEYRAPSLAPVEITGEWTVTVEASAVSLPYAEVRDDPDDRGQRERWYAEEPGTREWSRLWLSPMNCSFRTWNLIGPFPNLDDRGLDGSFPPEREIDLQAAYEGDGGREIRWVTIDNDRERLDVTSIDWRWATLQDEDARYAPRANIIDYGELLKMAAAPAGVVYAQTNVYSPEAHEATLLLAASSPNAAWLNGHQVHSRWVRPVFYDLHDGFAYRIPVRLNAGWNSLLLKILGGRGRGGPAFTCRLEGTDGRQIPGLVTWPQEVPADRMVQPGSRWLRFPVPRVAAALRVPALEAGWQAFVDGEPVPAAREIPLPGGSRSVVVRVSAWQILDRPFELVVKPAAMPLGTWTIPGLEHFSGSMIYEKTVNVPAALLTERVLLDCGQVGVCAEAWVNGEHAGAQPWEPYVFDVTGHLRPGANHLKLRIANTEANARAVGPSIGLLKSIDVNGWLGPAQLVPYFEREIRCVPSRSGAD